MDPGGSLAVPHTHICTSWVTAGKKKIDPKEKEVDKVLRVSRIRVV
jgi:hypothetical protein